MDHFHNSCYAVGIIAKKNDSGEFPRRRIKSVVSEKRELLPRIRERYENFSREVALLPDGSSRKERMLHDSGQSGRLFLSGFRFLWDCHSGKEHTSNTSMVSGMTAFIRGAA